MAEDNSTGFELSHARRSVLKRNSARGNRDSNHVLGDGTSRNTLVGNVSSDGGVGFNIQGDRNTLRANRVTGPRSHGIALRPGGDKNVLTANGVTGGSGNGFDVLGVRNRLTDNVANENRSVGFGDGEVPGWNTYADNICLDNRVGGSEPEGLCDDSVPVEAEPPTQPSESPDPDGATTANG